MCKILKVDISSYYHWINNGCIVKTVDDKLNELIEIIFIQSRCKYGTRRLKDKLERLYGLIVSRRRIGNIMKDLNLVANKKKRFKVNTTDSNHNLQSLFFNDLFRCFPKLKVSNVIINYSVGKPNF